MEHIENLLVVVVPAQLADPVQQAEQNTRELKQEQKSDLPIKWLLMNHLKVISGYVLCERVATISQVLGAHSGLRMSFEQIDIHLHVEGKVRANVQKLFDGGEQLRRGEKAIVKAAVQEVAVLCQHFVNLLYDNEL